MDAVGPLVHVDLGELLLADEHAAHAGAHDDADPMRVLALDPEPRVRHRLLGRQERELRVAIVAVGLDALGQLRGVEVQHLSRHLRAVAAEGQLGQILPGGQGTDAGAAGQRGLPEDIGADADGRDHAEARDDDPLAHRHCRSPETIPHLLRQTPRRVKRRISPGVARYTSAMMAEETPTAVDTLSRALARERVQSARHINLVRVCGVSAFFALFIVLGVVLRLPGWTGNLGLFTAYWLVAAALFWAGPRVGGEARLASLAIALVDVPMVFFLQWATLATSPSASGVAGFTVGVYVLLVILAALSLESRLVLLTATFAAFFEILLQHLAGVGEGAMVSTVILLGLGAAACSYARLRLVALARARRA